MSRLSKEQFNHIYYSDVPKLKEILDCVLQSLEDRFDEEPPSHDQSRIMEDFKFTSERIAKEF